MADIGGALPAWIRRAFGIPHGTFMRAAPSANDRCAEVGAARNGANRPALIGHADTSIGVARD